MVKTTSHKVDDLHSVLRCKSVLNVNVSIESAIGPGRIIAVAWFKSCDLCA